MNEMNDKDRSGLIEEIDRLKKELVEEKEKAEMNFRYYIEEAGKFRRFREAIRSVVTYIDHV